MTAPALALAVASLAALLALACLALLARRVEPLDRAVAAAALAQSAIVTIAGLSAALAQPRWLEIAFLAEVFLFGFAVALLKLARYRSLQPQLAGRAPEGGRDA